MTQKELDEKVLLQITDQVGQLIDDYKSEIEKGFVSAVKDFKIGFAVKLAPQKEAGKTKVTTVMNFETEPKPEHPGKVKDSMEVIVDTKQNPLPGMEEPAV
jgi:hypothetical protein